MQTYTPKRSLLALAIASSAALLGNAAPVFADSAQLEEVVVTARRNEESAQTVPIAISAISGEALANNRIENGVSLQKLVPALTIYSQTRDEETFSIRGLSGSGASAQGQAPSVTTYFAQVPLPTGDGGGPGRYFDLQNVQVLKGPQGTLFGRNSTGGAVLFEPQRPTNNLEGYVQGQLGNYNDQEFEGAINLPIVDNLLTTRLSLKTARRDGFTKNVTLDQELDDRDYQSVRLSVLFTPTDSFENLFVFDYFKSNTRGGSSFLAGPINASHIVAPPSTQLPLPIKIGGAATLGELGAAAAANDLAAEGAIFGAAIADGGAIAFFPIADVNAAYAQQAALGKRKVQSDVSNLDKIEAWGASDAASYTISDGLTLKNILGYRRYQQVLRYDLDGSALPLLDQTDEHGPTASIEQISDELQLQGSSFNEKLDWTVGAFGLTVRTPDTQMEQLTGFGSPTQQTTDTKGTSRSLYGQATYDLGDLVDGLKFTAGYRYTKDHRELRETSFTNGNCELPAGDPNVNFAACNFDEAKNFGSGSYTVGLDYQLTPDALVYLATRKGYRSGGLNTGGAQVGESAYGPEHVTDIEAGVKADWHFDNGMSARTNVAIYRTKRNDAQVSESFTEATPSGDVQDINLIVNQADATIKGLEFDGELAFTQGVELTASYAYTDAVYDKYFDIPSQQTLKDMPYPFAPRDKLNLGARYHLPLSAEVGDVSAQVNWSHSSMIHFGVVPDPYANQSAYSTVDAFIYWNKVLNSGFDASLFCTNLTDKVYKIGGVPIYDAVGFTSVIYSEPRMFGMTVKYKFGPNS